MGVGFLHGVLPQGISTDSLLSPQQIQVLTTDEILFPANIRSELEKELHVRFSVIVTRDWESLLANAVASPSADLIFLPSYWANTLAQQNLLSDFKNQHSGDLLQRVASDFMKPQGAQGVHFLPFYWIKTTIETDSGQDFLTFLRDKSRSVLFLLADEDLLLRHFQIWKEQGLLEQVLQKKILSLQLDQLAKKTEEGAVEAPLHGEHQLEVQPFLNALLIWGAVVPNNSANQELIGDILNVLSSAEYQERTLLKTPFNSTFHTVSGKDIPRQRRADFIRDLQLKETIILDSKDQDARLKLKNEFNFIL